MLSRVRLALMNWRIVWPEMTLIDYDYATRSCFGHEQVMWPHLTPWTLLCYDYDKILRIVLIHINYHNNILIILVNLRMLWNNMGAILIQVETSLHHFNMFEYTQPYFVFTTGSCPFDKAAHAKKRYVWWTWDFWSSTSEASN